MQRVQIKSNLTAQLISKEPASPEHPHLAFWVHCPDCGTVRGFRLVETQKHLRSGASAACKIVTYCEACQRRFEVSMGLINAAQPGWTTRPPFNDEGDCHGVIDQIGLTKSTNL